MTVYYGTNASGGAPTLAGVNGSLCTLLDYWLNTIAGWAIEYTAANNRVYRAANGNRFRLFVCHDSATSGDARLAVVRGCENASAAGIGTLTDPFPTVAQVGNTAANWRVSNTASATTRAYHIVVDNGSTSGRAFVRLAVDINSTPGTGIEIGWFGDDDTNYAGDTYATSICTRNSTSATSIVSPAGLSLSSNLASAASCRIFFCRDITGAVKSSYVGLNTINGSSSPGMVAGLPALQAGYNGTVNREAISLNCTGSAVAATTSTTLSLYKRAFTANLWQTLVSGQSAASGITPFDTFQDPAYNAGSDFLIVNLGNVAGGVNTGAVVFETTDTWTSPSG